MANVTTIEAKDIYVVGDLHGKWPKFNTWLQKKNPEAVFQVGDFGYWPKADGTYDIKLLQGTRTREKKVLFRQCGIKNPNTTIYWLKGNHEDHESILTIEDHEICPGVIYMPFGSVIRLPDGRNVLFVGGASTHNPGAYQMGLDVFPALETAKLYDLPILPDMRIDIVISHTCPKRWIECMVKYNYVPDETIDVLDRILFKYQPSLWYFGHFHEYKTGFDSDTNTRWTALGMLGQTGWFEKLK